MPATRLSQTAATRAPTATADPLATTAARAAVALALLFAGCGGLATTDAGWHAARWGAQLPTDPAKVEPAALSAAATPAARDLVQAHAQVAFAEEGRSDFAFGPYAAGSWTRRLTPKHAVGVTVGSLLTSVDAAQIWVPSPKVTLVAVLGLQGGFKTEQNDNKPVRIGWGGIGGTLLARLAPVPADQGQFLVGARTAWRKATDVGKARESLWEFGGILGMAWTTAGLPLALEMTYRVVSVTTADAPWSDGETARGRWQGLTLAFTVGAWGPAGR